MWPRGRLHVPRPPLIQVKGSFLDPKEPLTWIKRSLTSVEATSSRFGETSREAEELLGGSKRSSARVKKTWSRIGGSFDRRKVSLNGCHGSWASACVPLGCKWLKELAVCKHQNGVCRPLKPGAACSGTLCHCNLAAKGRGIPAHARAEIERFLACGLLPHGFARVRCADGGFERLVAFACKGRCLCPSCGARRVGVAKPLGRRCVSRGGFRWVGRARRGWAEGVGVSRRSRTGCDVAQVRWFKFLCFPPPTEANPPLAHAAPERSHHSLRRQLSLPPSQLGLSSPPPPAPHPRPITPPQPSSPPVCSPPSAPVRLKLLPKYKIDVAKVFPKR
jgi:hypothetical protein